MGQCFRMRAPSALGQLEGAAIQLNRHLIDAIGWTSHLRQQLGEWGKVHA